jgi:hypothetical protein
MKADAVRMAMIDFQKVAEKVDSITMQITLSGDNEPLNVGSEAKIEVLLDGNVLIVKDQDTICYVDCNLIDIIEIW